MPRVIFVQPDGATKDVEVAAGRHAMLAAISNGVRGIDGDCGATLSCATCHVYVDAAWADRLPEPGEDEMILLEGVAAERQPNSRLSCQIIVTPELDGLRLGVPTRQS